MIHPSTPVEPKGLSMFMRCVYYIVAFLLAFANFFPLLQDSPYLYEQLPTRTIYLLIVCYLLAVPLLFELFMDVVVAFITGTELKEYRFGYVINLLSLFLPIFAVHGVIERADSTHGVLFTNCFVAFLQTLTVLAQYDKVMFVTNNHWSVLGSLLSVLVFVWSQISQNFAVSYNPGRWNNYNTENLEICLASSLFLGILCCVLHILWSKKYSLDYMRWDTNEWIGVVLQGTIGVYFIVNCIITAVFLVKQYDSQYYLNVGIITHIILVLCSSIIPGRVTRRKLAMANVKMSNKDTFIRYVSHEIRSPLSTTSLGLHYLLEKLSNKSITVDDALIVVQESVVTCELAMSTLNDFLMLDKIQNNMLEISMVKCSASDFMVDAIRPFSLQALSSDVTLTCNVESVDGFTCRDVNVEIDSYKMSQVLRNLLSNAFKFTPSGGTVTVTMTTFECPPEECLNVSTSHKYFDGSCSMVRIEVTDTGCGISKDNLPKLFGQYVQFDAEKLQGGKGSGLGLWLSKAIVEMHGGMIGATSKGEGLGCTFWFTVPCHLQGEDRSSFVGSRRNSFVSRNFSISVPSSPAPVKTAANSHADIVMEFEPLPASEKRHSVPPVAKHNINLNIVDTRSYSKDIESGLPVKYTSSDSQPLAPYIALANTEPKKFVDLHIETTQSVKVSKRSSFSPTHKKPSPMAAASVSKVRNLKVLLVDDSSIARKMVERSLMTIKHAECFHARHGAEAVEKVVASMSEGEPFDVILMDHYMPEMNGPEAVTAIRAKGYTGIIIGVSGNGSSDVGFYQMKKDKILNKVMVKPFNLDRFLVYMKEFGLCESKGTK